MPISAIIEGGDFNEKTTEIHTSLAVIAWYAFCC